MDKNNDTQNKKLASLSFRLLAFIIDEIFIAVIVLFVYWDQLTLHDDIESITAILNSMFMQVVMLRFAYQTFFIWYYGATLGKIMTKIKVVDCQTFKNVSLSNSALRSMGRVLSAMVFYIGFVIAFFLDSKQTFHDKVGKTLVIDA